MMGSRSSLAGTEVPIIGTDSIKWVQVSVPSSSSASPSTEHCAAPPTNDVASSFAFGNPPTYLIWRIHKSRPHTLEIVELSGYKECPRIGLQIVFADALCPFALIYKNENPLASGDPYILYALTVAGVAYLIKLKDIYNYASGSVFPPNEIFEFKIQTYRHYGAITAVAATAGHLVIGGNDGSVGCFQIGMLDPTAPGFLHELRDDASYGRLWGLISRKTVAAVQDLLILEVQGKKLLFVLHSDGILQIWDLLSYRRVFSHTMNPTLAGATFLKFWGGEANNDASIFPLAFLHTRTSEVNAEIISVYNLRLSVGDRANFMLAPSIQNISLEEGGVIDVKISSNKIWILKEDGLVMQDLLGPNDNGEVAHCYGLQEAFVAQQLFQSPEYSSDDLLWLVHSVYSSLKEQIAPFVSSIFLRKLLLPGVYHNGVVRATLQDHNKHLTDSEFYSLTAEEMKNEILSIIEHEGVSRSPLSVIYCWKTFCSHYFENWCRNNAPCGLLIDSSANAIGLIRKTSISLFRSLEDIELLTLGSFDDFGEIISSGINFSDDLEREILFEVLRCTSYVNQQLGKAASALFYESFLSEANMSCEEVVPRLLKILETGYTPSVAALHISELGADAAWEKEVVDHKNLRKFSTDMFLSLHGLYGKAATWVKVLDVILRYINFLVPRKTAQKLDSGRVFDISTSITVQATSQVAKVMFESALDVLMLLSYMMKISGQIQMLDDDVSRVQLELVPMIQEIITEWHIIHFLATTPSESPTMDDFSSQLSSLQIDSNIDRRSWSEKLGKSDFALAFVLLLNDQNSFEDRSHCSLKGLPNPSSIISSAWNFISWIIWGRGGEESSVFLSHSTELALILLRHGQCGAVEYLLTMVDTHLRKEKISESIQSVNNEWCKLLHVLGCCLLSQAYRGSHGSSKEKKVCEALRCFFRAASVQGAPQALPSLSYEAGLPYLGFTGSVSGAAWKLHYYQWAMQIFERYNFSEGACHFALAALEQVDEVLGPNDSGSGSNLLNESSNTVKGRLWANVFKFTLDLNRYFDAYCAITSNPDEESKFLCLRRFVIILYEHGAVKILCDGQLPFIGLAEKVEQELAWKAERSDISVKPNPYKLLYAFEMHQHNWRRAASYIYLYSAQLKTEAALKDHQLRSLALQERLNCLSAAINALHLVHPAYAWIDPLAEGKSLRRETYPSKKARITIQEQSADDDSLTRRLQSCLDIEKLEKEFVLTSAEYLLSLANVRWKFTGIEKPPPDLIELLVQSNLHDMAFTVLLKFFKGSALKRELERVFIAMSLKCCPSKAGSSLVGNDFRMHGLLLTSSKDEDVVCGSPDMVPSAQQSKGNREWETLELYIEKYYSYHPRLPVIVAETLLCADPQIELPLWLVHMFKGIRRERCWGMAGSESSPASLFQLYVDYGRYAEATNLLLEYIESFASVRPADVILRKRTFAVWFPYTTIERLWCQLEESISLGHMIDQCEKLKTMLHGALLKHFSLLKIDSADVQSAATQV